MFPSLTFSRTRFAALRVLAGVVGALCLLLAAATTFASAGPSGDAATSQPLPMRLATGTWALAVPLSWLGTPVTGIRTGDKVDLLAVRMGERPLAIPLAADLRVVSVEDAALVFEVDEEAATAIATARASNLLVLPLLRSSR